MLLLIKAGEDSLFKQVYQFYKNEILEGRLKKGEKMPSIRQLARELHHSINTVNAAYQQLIAEGYLENVPRKGLFVARIGKIALIEKTNQKKEEILNATEDKKIIFNLRQANIDENAFPMKAWRKAIQQALDNNNFQYGDFFGETALQQKLADYLYRFRAVRCTPRQILIGSSVQLLLILLCMAECHSSKTVIFEEPAYAAARQVFIKNGYDIQLIKPVAHCHHLEGLKNLQSGFIYLTPSNHYPLGGIISVSLRLEILQWASENGSYVIEDDYDSEFRYNSKPIPAMQALDQNDRVIYIGTFSKALMPSLRVAYMVIPSLLLPYFKNISLLEQTVPSFVQKALAILMEDEWEKHLRKMRKIYKEKNNLLVETARKIFPENVKIVNKEAGLNILLSIKNAGSEDELVEKAKQSGILTKGTFFAYHKKENLPADPCLFLGYGSLKKESIPVVLEKLRKTWFG